MCVCVNRHNRKVWLSKSLLSHRGPIAQYERCPSSVLPAPKSVFQDWIRHNSLTRLSHSGGFSKCGCEMWPGVSSAVLAHYPTIHSGLVSLMVHSRGPPHLVNMGEYHMIVIFIRYFHSCGPQSLSPSHRLDMLIITGCCKQMLWILGRPTVC